MSTARTGCCREFDSFGGMVTNTFGYLPAGMWTAVSVSLLRARNHHTLPLIANQRSGAPIDLIAALTRIRKYALRLSLTGMKVYVLVPTNALLSYETTTRTHSFFAGLTTMVLPETV